MTGGGNGRTAGSVMTRGASGTRAASGLREVSLRGAAARFGRPRGFLLARRVIAAAQPINRGAGQIVGVATLLGHRGLDRRRGCRGSDDGSRRGGLGRQRYHSHCRLFTRRWRVTARLGGNAGGFGRLVGGLVGDLVSGLLDHGLLGRRVLFQQRLLGDALGLDARLGKIGDVAWRRLAGLASGVVLAGAFTLGRAADTDAATGASEPGLATM